ncbi:MAG TPA: 50S ribosomal protein L11 methyltransferase [Candidatus Acidoferrales bacterium]|nr:50S ribosomal protein L11 methyltransferase [Candidatus Acidoferrales bacterium]
MYSLEGYADMLADKVRHNAMCRAMRQIVKPGSVVLEIGTGPGFFAILACQAGASRVFAIESSDVIQVAREIAVANNFSDRIVFFEGFSTKVTLPERVDIVFSDLRGILPLFAQNIPSIIDARERFLKPQGVLSPRKDTILVAVVDLPKVYSRMVDSWEQSAPEQNLSPARRRAVNCMKRARATPDQLLSEPRLWVTLDYSTIASPDARGEVQWTVKRSGTGHGLLAWFDADLADGVLYSNSPFGPETIHASMFFPWEHPVNLAQGDTVCVQLDAKLVGDDYVFRWETHVKPASLQGQTRDLFKQSTFQGYPLPPGQIHKSASDHVPVLTEEAVLSRRVLNLMDGRATLEDIARALTTEFPERFTGWHEALKFAGAVSQKYSR